MHEFDTYQRGREPVKRNTESVKAPPCQTTVAVTLPPAQCSRDDVRVWVACLRWVQPQYLICPELQDKCQISQSMQVFDKQVQVSKCIQWNSKQVLNVTTQTLHNPEMPVPFRLETAFMNA